MNANVMVWEPEQRRVGSLAVLGAAVVVALAALAVWWFVAATPAWVYWALVAVLVVVLLFAVALIFIQRTAPAAEVAGEMAMAEDVAASAEASAEAPAYEPRVLTLRCGDCGTIFDVTDTGERPLYHTCPGCGAEGALRDPVVEAPPAEAAPDAYAAPEADPAPVYAPAPHAPAPHGHAPAAPAPAVGAAPTVRKLKLRCGGCKEIFSIDDSGERPLRRGCPHCGRMGQIS